MLAATLAGCLAAFFLNAVSRAALEADSTKYVSEFSSGKSETDLGRYVLEISSLWSETDLGSYEPEISSLWNSGETELKRHVQFLGSGPTRICAKQKSQKTDSVSGKKGDHFQVPGTSSF